MFLPQKYQPFQQLIKPDVKKQSTPHPFTLTSNYIYGLIGLEPDTMRLHEAMKKPYRLQFLPVMQKELEDHVLSKHWKVIPLRSLSPNKRPLPMV